MKLPISVLRKFLLRWNGHRRLTRGDDYNRQLLVELAGNRVLPKSSIESGWQFDLYPATDCDSGSVSFRAMEVYIA